MGEIPPLCPAESIGSVGLIGIGIPTYNRRSSVTNTCESLLESDSFNSIPITVVDDGSTDGTSEALLDLARSNPRLRITRHESNLGFARAFATIFEASETEWLILSSDDDRLEPQVFSTLQPQLKDADFDFLSTRWIDVEGNIARGRESNRWISPKHVQASANHAPALVFRRTAVLPLLTTLRSLCDAGSTAALTYPQVVVAAHLIAARRARWSPIILGREGERLASGLTDEQGRPYWHPEARVEQAIQFRLIYRSLVRAHPPRSRERWRAHRIALTNERTLIGYLNRLLKHKDPDHDHLLLTALRALIARL